MGELKPCPFCGDMPNQIIARVVGDLDYISCAKCDYVFDADAHGGHHGDAWNTRPIEDAKDAEIARLEGVVEELVNNLKVAHDIIEKNIDIEAFGIESDGESCWPVLTEYLAKFNQAIAKADEL